MSLSCSVLAMSTVAGDPALAVGTVVFQCATQVCSARVLGSTVCLELWRTILAFALHQSYRRRIARVGPGTFYLVLSINVLILPLFYE